MYDGRQSGNMEKHVGSVPMIILIPIFLVLYVIALEVG